MTANDEKKGRGDMIRFSDTYSETCYKLMELPEDLMEVVERGERLMLKGEGAENVVLCSRTKTYDVKLAETSNTLLLLPAESDCDKENGTTTRSILGSCTSYYELKNAKPNTASLNTLLMKCPYAGAAREAQLDSDTAKRYTFELLLENVQASEMEVKAALDEMGALQINDHWRLVYPPYLNWTFDAVLAVVVEEGLDLAAVSIDRVLVRLRELQDSGELVPHQCGGVDAMVVQHAMKMYSTSTTVGSVSDDAMQIEGQEASPGTAVILALDRTKIATFRAEQLLWSRDPKQGAWGVSEFIEAWEASMPDSTPPDRAILKGLALEETHGPRLVLQPVRRSELPAGVKERFAFLFALRPKWLLDDLRPFIGDLVTSSGKTEAALLLTSTRSSAQPGSTERLYSARR